MKKTLLAVFIAATAVIGTQAIAGGNGAQVVVNGTVFDDTESCNVTPKGAITNSTVVLDDIKANELEKLAVNTPSLAFAKDVIYIIEDCRTGGSNYSGNLEIDMAGNFIPGQPEILSNEAIAPAANSAITLLNKDNTRVKFDGSAKRNVPHTPGVPTIVQYKATYVKTAPGVVAGAIKGITTFTISY